MAHEIDFQTGQAGIAFIETEGTPWHGLGTPVKQAMNANEAIELGRLNWKVEKQPCFTKNDQVIPNYFSVVREDTGFPLGVVKSKYQILQNSEAFNVLDSFTSEGLKYHVIGSLDNGRKIWLLAKLPGQIRVIGQDVIDKYLLLSNSHDGSQTLRIAFTPVRVVCNNTLTLAQNHLEAEEYLLNVKHTQSMSKKIAKVKDLFIDIERRSKDFEENAQRMVCKNVNDEQITKFLYDVLGYGKEINSLEDVDNIPTRTVNVVNKILELHETGRGSDLSGVKGTVWGAYNAVTEYADYYSSVRGNDQENRLDSALFGNLSRLKDKAYNKALELVTV